ncbi:hypothetical protein CLCR_11297 [Cladophialophora carrionii]|uniref:Uncharacterized protein n=1 Tax=Cladophialophora carrionii TaxID=86049 RepID=A0A1C1CJD3_9EURO|nr:hypothetical protein CLCR_11297 [Cladophialophora carrionii]
MDSILNRLVIRSQHNGDVTCPLESRGFTAQHQLKLTGYGWQGGNGPQDDGLVEICQRQVILTGPGPQRLAGLGTSSVGAGDAVDRIGSNGESSLLSKHSAGALTSTESTQGAKRPDGKEPRDQMRSSRTPSQSFWCRIINRIPQAWTKAQDANRRGEAGAQRWTA